MKYLFLFALCLNVLIVPAIAGDNAKGPAIFLDGTLGEPFPGDTAPVPTLNVMGDPAKEIYHRMTAVTEKTTWPDCPGGKPEDANIVKIKEGVAITCYYRLQNNACASTARLPKETEYQCLIKFTDISQGKF